MLAGLFVDQVSIVQHGCKNRGYKASNEDMVDPRPLNPPPAERLRDIKIPILVI
jgi:hypothetical protein